MIEDVKTTLGSDKVVVTLETEVGPVEVKLRVGRTSAGRPPWLSIEVSIEVDRFRAELKRESAGWVPMLVEGPGGLKWEGKS